MPDNDNITNELIAVNTDSTLPAEPQVIETETIRLLEEQLVVDRHKQKVGEIIVRKVVETRLVEVPVRSEKLIVEQLGPENRQLAEIKLGEGTISGVEDSRTAARDRVSGDFFSLEAASNLLRAIATQRRHGCKRVRIELVLDDEHRQPEYQEMFDRCTKR
ncbi:MAG: DUF2382 domain-containing protein [Cyanophyceae cyanobacterium]